MTKHEFMTRLSAELRRAHVADAAEIEEEYAQHFAFKLADGYSEEEIAAKLGEPEALAAQFCGSSAPRSGARRAVTVVGIGVSDVIGALLFLLLAAWGLVMAAAAIAFAGTAVCLLAGWDLNGLLPPAPYWCGAVAALALLALAVLAAVGTVWFAALLRQLLRAFRRCQQNALAESAGHAALPELPAMPQLQPKTARGLRRTALIALLLFAVCMMLTYVVCAVSAGNIQFWHTWGWFGRLAI